MLPSHALRAIDMMLRDITNLNETPFGSKVFLLGGDFRQTLPVLPHQPRTVIIQNCINRSELWPLFKVIKLTKNMRAHDNESDFSKWLLKLGDGSINFEDKNIGQRDLIEIPEECHISSHGIVDDIFDDMSDINAISSTVILTPKNDTSLQLNEEIMNKKVSGPSAVYVSVDKAICNNEEEASNYQMEFLNSLTPSGMPPHRLTLKKNAIVMLLRNLNIKEGLFAMALDY